MPSLTSTPLVSLAIIRRLVWDDEARIWYSGREHPALVWDPAAVRAVLDETRRTPVVAMLARKAK